MAYAFVPGVRAKINGLFSNSDSEPILSPSEVREHPNQYLGEKITIEGYYLPVWGICEKTLGNDPYSEIVYVKNASNFNLIGGGEYRFTGVLEQSETYVWCGVCLNLLEVEAV
ncbi:hypothetical protein AKJ58_01310 [candidate division MSBL1 archaeon SCGC-AAA385D11]|uniref:Uncharacterized protein n=1 Tax=candidate division MSBL1 archaeon SCGC-AAA385D11 TaxID=1698286 RepID=A0A133VND4_9EURY|nr:hypothetical protein AKJ58_01310 [candidate division MSBL1 archaeon SCGC-AAA385D11]